MAYQSWCGTCVQAELHRQNAPPAPPPPPAPAEEEYDPALSDVEEALESVRAAISKLETSKDNPRNALLKLRSAHRTLEQAYEAMVTAAKQ
jgi:hypothetical protein